MKVPETIQEALSIPKWQSAIMEEIRALKKNGTWELVQLPNGKRTMSCKRMFTSEYKADETLDKLKACLVARGFTQTYGLDYEETFALVAKLNTIRVLLSMAADLEWPLHQLDIKNAFLNGELKKEVYMTPPLRFDKDREKQVCKLDKSIYGLKHSLRAWFDGKTSEVQRLQANPNEPYNVC